MARAKKTNKKVDYPESDFLTKVKQGLELYHKRLIQTTKKNNDYLIIEQNGKIVKFYPKKS